MGDEAGDGDALSKWLEVARGALDVLTGGAMDVIGILDRDLRIRYVNFTGPSMTREQAVGLSILDLTPPDYREIALATYTKVLETAVGARFDTIYEDGGELRLWDTRIGPIRADGKVIGVIGITSNVTEQRREQADRDRFFSLSLDMLCVTNPEGRFKRANPAFSDSLGYAVAELLGKPFIDLVHPDDRASTMDVYRGVLGGTPISGFENRYRSMDGKYRVFSWRATVDPVTGDVYAVARDVSDHRATEAQLRHSQKMEAIGQLAGGVAHDFNNLMQAVLINAELAMAGAMLPDETVEHLKEIENAGVRAAALTKQLLAFSRRQPLRPVPVDINGLIRRLMKMLTRLLPENIVIDFIPGHSLASVSADPTQLEQVIVNLCVNARDAMAQGGRLTLETESVVVNGNYRELHPWARPGRYVLLSVTDTGVGMTAEERERAFEPFFTTKSAHEGTGLGLSTVYGIIQQHGGMLHLYSEPGDGSTFKIYLPVHARMAEDVGTKIEATPAAGHETILLAEDEELVRRAVTMILERAGYQVIAAADGQDALRLMREETRDVQLALLDVVMPRLGGPETWEQLARLRPGLRVLFASGYADDRHVTRMPEGAEVVQKPFRSEELLRRVRQKLDE